MVDLGISAVNNTAKLDFQVPVSKKPLSLGISDFVDVWWKNQSMHNLCIYEGKADVRVRSHLTPFYAVPTTYSVQQPIMSWDRAQAHVVVEERGLLCN